MKRLELNQFIKFRPSHLLKSYYHYRDYTIKEKMQDCMPFLREIRVIFILDG
jgi:hypothetical protein